VRGVSPDARRLIFSESRSGILTFSRRVAPPEVGPARQPNIWPMRAHSRNREIDSSLVCVYILNFHFKLLAAVARQRPFLARFDRLHEIVIEWRTKDNGVKQVASFAMPASRCSMWEE
jgi:hypothetical protein